MNNKMEEQIKQSFEDLAPDLLNMINEKPVEKIESEEELFGKQKKPFYFRVSHRAAIVVAACLCIFIGFGLTFQQSLATTTVTFDVNPSIEMDVNGRNQVNSVKAVNEDGERVLQNVNIGDSDNADVVVEKIVDELQKEKYFDKDKNVILFSVFNKNKKKAEKVCTELSTVIEKKAEQNNIDATLVNQVLKTTTEISKYAESQSISKGKAALLLALNEKDSNKTLSELLPTVEEKKDHDGLSIRKIGKSSEGDVKSEIGNSENPSGDDKKDPKKNQSGSQETVDVFNGNTEVIKGIKKNTEKTKKYTSTDGMYEGVADEEQTEICINRFAGNRSENSKLEVPEQIDGMKVVEIGVKAFQGDAELTEITIPSTVTKVGESAFEGCTALKSLNLPNSVEEVGARAFAECSELDSVILSTDMKEITNQMFLNCKKLKSVIITEQIESMGDEAFKNTSIEKIEFPASLKSIGDSCFEGNNNLTEADFLEGFESIGDKAFLMCSSLKTLKIPKTVTDMGVESFEDCTGLTDISISNDNNTYTAEDGVIYTKDKTKILQAPGASGLVKLSDSTEKVEDRAFYHSSVEEVIFPDSVVEIGHYAFSECNNLKRITLAEGLKEIGEGAFSFSPLEKLLIPESVTEIESYAFEECKIANLDLKNIKTIGQGAFIQNPIESLQIPQCTVHIGDQAFSGCSKLRKLEFEEGVKELGAYSFENCDINDVLLPESIKRLGTGAFNGNENMQTIDVCEGNKKYISEDNAVYSASGKTLVAAIASGEKYKVKKGVKKVKEDFLINKGSVKKVIK